MWSNRSCREKGTQGIPRTVARVLKALLNLDKIVLDPDQEVQGAVRMIFSLFQQIGSAFGVVKRFHELGLLFHDAPTLCGGCASGCAAGEAGRRSLSSVGNRYDGPTSHAVFS